SAAASPTEEQRDPLQGLALELVAEGFTDPVLALSPPDDERVFVVERGGRVLTVRGQAAPELFLDISSTVSASRSIEQGLLGMAFHPRFADNGRFFVYHSLANDDNQLVEHTADPDREGADPASARALLTIAKAPDM